MIHDFRNQKVTVFKKRKVTNISGFWIEWDDEEIDCTTVKKTFNSNEIVIHYRTYDEIGKISFFSKFGYSHIAHLQLKYQTIFSF